MTVILDLSDPAATELAVSGGKGASLARTAGGLPVPPGFVLTAEAYRAFLSPLVQQVEEILSTAADDLDATADAVAGLVRSADLPAAWHAEVEEALARTGIGDRAVAVRSSGTMEDLPGAAFAGQHDTYLGVRGAAGVLAAVRDCFASLWNRHAVRYRDRLGVDHRDAAMAVVVQLLVDVAQDESAGVAFSVDPVRGRLDEVLVNAAFGLGETVVGGEDPVDEYRIRRSDLTLVDRTVEEKPRAILSHHGGGGTVTVELPVEQAAAPALSPDQVAEVARLAVAAEEHAGFPQDIEWAFSGGELFLLQSRPVTRVAPRWTRDESAERFPTPVTPLTWDLVEAGFHESLNYSFRLMGLPPFPDKWFAVRDSYVYGNQTAVQLYAGRLPTGMLRDVQSLITALPTIARDFRWVQELPHRWARDLDTYLLGIGRLSSTDLEALDEARLWDHVKEISALGTTYFLPNIAISLTQRTLYGALLQMLRMGLTDTRANAVLDTLLASTDTKTGQVNEELWHLSRAIRADRDLHEALAAHPGEDGPAVLHRFPAFAAEFDGFLSRHGHRELDFDAYHPTWVEVPHIVLDQVRLMAERPDEDNPAEADLRRRVAQADAERAVVDAAPDPLKYLVQEVIRLARTYTALDDLEHYQTTRLTLPLRRAARALGGRLVGRGVLDEPMDVFFLHASDLDEALGMPSAGSASSAAGAWQQLRQRAEQQKAAYLEAVARTPDWEHGVRGEDMGSGDVLTGTAGSPGVVEGEVFVVHGPEDFGSFPDGAILVARTTNPAWTALFYRASGVITESGGALSHGAVTARELGLPAVMAVRGATSSFTDGERVRVDGAGGTVARLG